MQDEHRLAARPDIAAMVASARGSALVALGDLDSAARVLTFQTADAPPPAHCGACRGLPRSGGPGRRLAWRGQKGGGLAERALASSDAPAADVALAGVSAERYDFTGPRSRLLRLPHGSPLPEGPLARAMLALARSRAARARGHLDLAVTGLRTPG